MTYYNVVAVRDAVVQKSGVLPVISSLTLSWRRVVAPTSANTWLALWLTKTALKLAWWSGPWGPDPDLSDAHKYSRCACWKGRTIKWGPAECKNT